MTTTRRFGSAALRFCAVVLIVVSWGFAAVLLVGYAVNPHALIRQLSDGTPIWPYQVAVMLILLLVGAGCLKLSRSARRRGAQPKHTATHHAAMPPDPLHLVPSESNREPRSLRRKLFLLSLLALVGIALLSGMVNDWLGPKPVLLGAIMMFTALGGSLALGVALARWMQAGRAEQEDEPLSESNDARPVLVMIWWPIVILSTGIAIFFAYISVIQGSSEGSGLPEGLAIVMGVFGFLSLPNLLSESRAQFRGRGLRGFWRGFRATEWGDGI